MNKVSITIITKNEEKNIERCLKSIGWADEIVIIDTFSTDCTVEICRDFTDKVFQEDILFNSNENNFIKIKINCAKKSDFLLDIKIMNPASSRDLHAGLNSKQKGFLLKSILLKNE